MKRLLLSAITPVFLLPLHSAYAYYEDEKPFYHSGAYVTGAVGAGWANADWDGNSSVSTTAYENVNQFIDESWTPSGDSSSGGQFAGRAALGFQFAHQALYIAAELGGDFSDQYQFKSHTVKNFEVSTTPPGLPPPPPQVTTAQAETFDTVTLNGNEFTIDLRPGFLMMQNMLLYARMGISFNKLEIESSGIWSASANAQVIPGPLVATGSAKSSDSVVGLRLGLGAEYLVSQHVGLSLDYVYTDYGNVNTTAEGAALSIPSNGQNLYGVNSPDVAVNNQTIMFGASWHW